MVKSKILKLPALEITQGPKRRIYSFAVDGKRLPEFATVSRIKRTESNDLFGYQRPEVVSHIAEIKRYVESESPMIPNSIVVAFDETVEFVPCDDSPSDGPSRHGHLHIPLREGVEEHEKPAWIVDGQQRAAAIRNARIDAFPISVVGFVAGSDEEQREQFLLVNSTKPLPKGLIYELIPSTSVRLPGLLERRRFPAYLLQRLNHQDGSPFEGLIQTPTSPDGVIKDNSVLRMLENSLSDGALYRFRGNGSDDDNDTESMLKLLDNYWSAVGRVFEEAWGLSPRKSRLMHGAGIVSMGFVMDAIADRHREDRIPTTEGFEEDLLPMRDSCSWCAGFWDFGPSAQVRWNDLQNTSKHIQTLTNFLIMKYKNLVWVGQR